jgi:hypothetical protein
LVEWMQALNEEVMLGQRGCRICLLQPCFFFCRGGGTRDRNIPRNK